MSLKIAVLAVKIRMKQGETLDEALLHYPRLTEDEKARIKAEIKE